jgi:predicted NBD/HSP70 family sugar kinase
VRSKDDTLRSVLRYVRTAAPCSRAEIAAATGLTKATVSTVVTELVDRRMLREIGAGGRRIGRPAALLMVDGSGYVGIGVRVCPDHLTAVAVDLADRRQFTWRRAFPAGDRSPRPVIAETARLVRRAVARVQAAEGSVVGLTVAVPGPVDSTGVVRGAPALGWPHVELRADLERALNRPTYPVDVDNDATLGAIAEHRYGAFAGTPHLAYLAGTPAGGVGLIHGGMPLRGANGYGGTFADLDGMIGRTGEPREIEIQRLLRQARAGEPDTVARLAEVGARLGHAVAVLVDLLNPAVVLLGGDYARLTPWLLSAAEREFRQRAVTPNADALKLAASTLGYEAPALGAAAVPLNVVERNR